MVSKRVKFSRGKEIFGVQRRLNIASNTLYLFKSHHMKSIYGLLFLFFSLSSVSAQSGKGVILGSVTDSLTGDPVEFATVALRVSGTESDINGTISDESGAWEITGLRPGSYDINISFIGYTNRLIKGIEISDDQPRADLGNLLLTSDQILLETVKVEGQRALVENKVDRLVYNAESDVTNKGGDAADVLRKVPMLSVDMEGNVSMRGSENIEILVNGKPSGIFSGSIADALKMIPADEIAKVEVITTPSAKYDGEGSGGIINIITAKNNMRGISGNANATLGTRQNRAAFHISAANKKFGLNGGGGAFFGWPQEGSSLFIREDMVGDQTRILRQEGITESSRLGFRGKFGAYYDFNEFNSLNSDISFRGFDSSNKNELESFFSQPMGAGQEPEIEEYIRLNDGSRFRTGFDWTTDFTHQFDEEGHEISLTYQLNGNVSKDDKVLERKGVQDASDDYKEKNKNIGDNYESTVQLDYSNPLTDNITLETGAKGVFRNINSEYDYRLFDPDANVYVDDPLGRSNEFLYTQNVYGGYASLNMKFADTWSAVVGARYEGTGIDGKLADGSNAFDQSYGNFLPSVILSKDINGSTLKASYSERIMRPRLFHINPYQNQEDEQNLRQGNPYLSPELTSQYELGYSTFIESATINFSTYYRRNRDIISSYLRVNQEGVSVSTFENVGVTDVYGANLFTSLSVRNNLTLRGNLDINQYHVVETGQELTVEDEYSNWISRVFVSASYNFGSGWKTELFAFRNSQRWSVQGSRPSFSMMNFGIQKEIFGDRGTIALTMVDPFNKSKTFKTDLRGSNFTQKSEASVPFRSFGLSFNYRFGNLNFEESDRRDGRGADGQGGERSPSADTF